MSVLALDLSTHTGFAFWKEGMPAPLSGALTLRGGGENLGPLATDARRKLGDLIAEHAPSSVVYEGPAVTFHKARGGGSSPQASRIMFGLAFLVEGLCHDAGANCFEAKPNDVRMHFCGQSRMKRDEAKRAVMEQCRRRDWPFGSDDEADALATLAYATFILRLYVPWFPGAMGPLFVRGRNALKERRA